MRTPVLLSTLLLACGGGSGGPSGTITLDTTGEPDLVAIKLGTGDWQVVEPAGNHYEIAVDDPYIVAVACNDVAGLFDTYLFARTPADDGELSAPCTGEGPPLDSRLQGTAVQAATITLGFSRFDTSDANQPFDLEASSGPHELIAQTDTAILIRRDLVLSGTTQLPAPLDVESEGEALVITDVPLDTAPDESPFGFVRLLTEHGTFASAFGDPNALPLAPDSVLTAADRQTVFLSAARGDLTRSVTLVDVRADTAFDVTLPDHLEGVALAEVGGTIAATWGVLPEHDLIDLNLQQTIDGSILLFHDLEISPAYADAMGTAITLDLAIPGFDPDAVVDVTLPYERAFSVSKDSESLRATSQLFESVNLPTDAKPARAAVRKRRIADRLP